MANFTMKSNPMFITVNEPGKIFIGRGQTIDVTFRVLSGSVSYNTIGEPDSNTPEFTEGYVGIVRVNDGDIHFDGSGTIAVEV